MVPIRDDFDNLHDDIAYMLGKYTLLVITYIIYCATDAKSWNSLVSRSFHRFECVHAFHLRRTAPRLINLLSSQYEINIQKI